MQNTSQMLEISIHPSLFPSVKTCMKNSKGHNTEDSKTFVQFRTIAFQVKQTTNEETAFLSTP